LRGTIVDGATGKACPGEITFAVIDRSAQGFGMTPSGEDGTFHVEGLTEGTYDLTARASGQRVGVLRGISVQAGIETHDLVFSLVPGAKLRVRYAGKVGYLQYQVLSEGTTFAGDGLAAGHAAETPIPSGHLVVECHWPPNSSETKEIDV